MGYSLFAEAGYASRTVTVVNNDRHTDIGALNKFLGGQGLSIADGYGTLKGKTFRVAHMADTSEADLRELFTAINAFIS